VNGDLTITTAGATYSGLDIHGFVYVEAPNVTLQDSIVRGGTPTTSIGLVNDTLGTGTNFTLRDSELAPSAPNVYIDGIHGANYTAIGVNIHGTVDGAKMFGDNSTIEQSWIHDLHAFASDPYQGGGASHDDDVQVLGGHNLRIINNTLAGGNNSAVQVTQTTESVTNLTIDGNLAGGGACTVNLQDAPLSSMSGISVDNNVFTHTSQYNCPITAYAGVSFSHTGDTWSDGVGTVAVVMK
jgi:hypothetical protein